MFDQTESLLCAKALRVFERTAALLDRLVSHLVGGQLSR